MLTRHLTLSKPELALGAWLLLAFIVGCTVVAAAAHYAVEKPAEAWLRARGPGRRPAGDGRRDNRGDGRRPPGAGDRPPEKPPEVGDRRSENAWTGPRHRRTGARPEPTYPAALQP